MSVPHCEPLSAKNLYNVSNIEIFWQNSGNYLAVKVDRTIKNKKVSGKFISVHSSCLKKLYFIQFSDVKERYSWIVGRFRKFALTKTTWHRFISKKQGLHQITFENWEINFFRLWNLPRNELFNYAVTASLSSLVLMTKTLSFLDLLETNEIKNVFFSCCCSLNQQ